MSKIEFVRTRASTEKLNVPERQEKRGHDDLPNFFPIEKLNVPEGLERGQSLIRDDVYDFFSNKLSVDSSREPIITKDELKIFCASAGTLLTRYILDSTNPSDERSSKILLTTSESDKSPCIQFSVSEDSKMRRKYNLAGDKYEVSGKDFSDRLDRYIGDKLLSSVELLWNLLGSYLGEIVEEETISGRRIFPGLVVSSTGENSFSVELDHEIQDL